jgi:3-phenylpropionate/trans-cinnamate dioxygenase ferredoxin component
MSEVRLRLSDLPDEIAVRVEGGPYGICVARLGDEVYALADRCSHQNWLLSDGEVEAADVTIECTKHGSTFSLKDGRPQCLPATMPVTVYPVRVEGDEVVVTVP